MILLDHSELSQAMTGPHLLHLCAVFQTGYWNSDCINPLNAELNPIRHLLALVGARHIVHVSRIRVKYLLAERENCTAMQSA